MPEIARFYGIVIKMFFKPKEHEPSHIHALYGEYMGEFNIQSMEMLQGDLPLKAQELVREWLGGPSGGAAGDVGETDHLEAPAAVRRCRA